VILLQTWHRSKEFIVIALPLIIILGILMQILLAINVIAPINLVLSPVVVGWLGLPIGVGVYLFYGVFRKELNLILLALYVASIGLLMTQYMTPIQMIVFTLTTLLYAPCMATIIVVKNQTSSKFAAQVFIYELLIALIFAGGIRWLYEGINSLFYLLPDFEKISLTFVFLIGITIVIILIINNRKNKINVKKIEC
jgi:ferrous iron transport protein B